jgi:hypothetical protein
MNTPEFKKHVTNLLKEEDATKEKNIVDTKPELQKYLKDVSIKVNQLKGADAKEIELLSTIIDGVIQDLEKGSLSPVLQQVLKTYDNRTKSLG